MNQALREILAIFKVDNSDLKKGVAEGEKFVDGLKDSLAGLAGPLLAAFSGGAIIGFTHDLLEAADATSKLADSLGLGIVEFQGWDHAANMSGVQTELLTMAFGKLYLGLNEVAEKGKGPAAEALKALGIEAEIAEGKFKSSGQVLEEVADAIQGMDVTKRNAALMKLFGEQGAKLVPMLKGGSAGVRALRNEVEELGFAFDDEFAAGAEEFNDNMTRLTKAGQGFLTQVLGPILPELVDLSQALVRSAKETIPLVKQFVAFTKQGNLLQTVLGGLVSGAVVLGIGKFAKLAGILKTVTGAALRFMLPLVAIDEIIGFLSGDDSLIGRKLDEWFDAGTADKVRENIKAFAADVFDFFSRLKSEAAPLIEEWGPRLERYGGVILLAAGAFWAWTAAISAWTFVTKGAAAAQVIFNAVMKMSPAGLLFAAIVALAAAVAAYWPEISGFFIRLWDKVTALGGIAGILEGAWVEIKFGALGLVATLSDAFAGLWNGIVSGAQTMWKTVAGLIEKVPFVGETAANGLKDLAAGADGFKMNTDASEVVAKQLQDARVAITDELAAKAEARQLTAGSSTTNNVTQDVQQTTQVNVTVPPGTPDTLASRVGAAAAKGAREGSGRNLRATQDALVPRPAG